MKHRATKLFMTFIVFGSILAGFGLGVASAYTVAEFGNGGFLDINYQVQLRIARSDIGSGPNQDEATTDVYPRRNRLGFLGALNENLAFGVQFEYNGGRNINDLMVSQEASEYEFETIDAYLVYTVANSFQLRAGKTKHILTREVNEGCFNPLSLDRSVFINGPFDKRTRDNGIVVWGNIAGDKLQYRLAAMSGNSDGSNKPATAGYRYSGRVHLSLLEPETGLGYRGSYLGKKKVLTLGAGYETEADAIYADDVAQTGAENYTAFTYDGFYEVPTEVGTFTLSAAYVKQDFNKAGLNGVVDATGIDGEKNGSYWKAAYLIGKSQIYVRLEDWTFAELLGVADQNVKWNAVGFNYFIKGNDLRVTLEHSTADFKTETSIARDLTVTTLQVQALF